MLWLIWPFSAGGNVFVQLLVLGMCMWPFDLVGLPPTWVLVLGVIVRLTVIPVLHGLLDPDTWKEDE